MRHYPLTGWHEQYLHYEADPDAHAGILFALVVKAAILLKHPLKLRRLNRAFREVCVRHDITRSHFVELGGHWRLRIPDDHPTGIEVHDYSGTAAEDIQQIVIDHTDLVLSMHDSALVKLALLRFGAHGDALVLRAHQSIMDGYGVTVLLEDLVKRMIGMPHLTPALSHEAYMQMWGHDKEPVDKDIERYWERKLTPPPQPLNIGRRKRGLPDLSNTLSWNRSRSLCYMLTEDEAQTISAFAHAESASPFMIFNAALMQTLAKTADSDDVLYSVTLGRSDGQLSNYAGHHTLHPFMRCRGISEQSVGSTARASMEELTESLAHLPSPAARRWGWWDQRLQEQGCNPRQILTGVNRAAFRAKLSPFAVGLFLEPGKWFGFGGFELMKVPLTLNAGDLDEFVVRPNLEQGQGRVDIRYDVDGYDDAEVEHLLGMTFGKLGIAPKPFSLLDTANLLPS